MNTRTNPWELQLLENIHKWASHNLTNNVTPTHPLPLQLCFCLLNIPVFFIQFTINLWNGLLRNKLIASFFVLNTPIESWPISFTRQEKKISRNLCLNKMNNWLLLLSTKNYHKNKSFTNLRNYLTHFSSKHRMHCVLFVAKLGEGVLFGGKKTTISIIDCSKQPFNLLWYSGVLLDLYDLGCCFWPSLRRKLTRSVAMNTLTFQPHVQSNLLELYLGLLLALFKAGLSLQKVMSYWTLIRDHEIWSLWVPCMPVTV